MDKLPRVEMYTDGSAHNGHPRGGWASLLRFRTSEGVVERLVTGRTDALVSNIVCEMNGLIYGLKSLKRPCEVVLTTDLEMLANGVNDGIYGWKENNWRNNLNRTIKNKDLWIEIYRLMQTHRVTARWTPGHTGHLWNELCDEMAGIARLGTLNNWTRVVNV